MILFPAVDLKNGQCVRLEQGDMARATVFNLDPAAQARAFAGQGFEVRLPLARNQIASTYQTPRTDTSPSCSRPRLKLRMRMARSSIGIRPS